MKTLDIYNDPTKVTKYTSKWEQYFDIYDIWFHKFVGESPIVLEIGVDNGGSLQMWNHYFGEGCFLYGLDIRPKVTAQELGLDNATILQGDQGNPDTWFKNGPIDVVIDDGSHFSNHQIMTFEKIFPEMSNGGIYLVEDTHSSYMDTFNGGLKQSHTFIEYCKELIDILHADHYKHNALPEWIRYIKSIHFYDSVVVIEKGLRPKYQVTFTHREDYIR